MAAKAPLVEPSRPPQDASRLLVHAAASTMLALVALLALAALHFWFLDMASALRTQFMLGDSDGRGQPTLCELDTRPLASRLDTVLSDPHAVLCYLRAWSTAVGEDTVVRHIFSRVEL